MFDHEGPAVVSAICNLTSGVFEHLVITSTMDVDQSLNYTQRLIRGAALIKYKAILTEYKESAKELAGYQYNLGDVRYLSQSDYELGLRKMGLTTTGVPKLDWKSASTLRGRFGSIWESACGGNIRAYSRITSNTFTMIF